MNRKRFNTEEDKDILLEVARHIKSGTMSLRQATEMLEARTGKKISHEGLRKIINGLGEVEPLGLES